MKKRGILLVGALAGVLAGAGTAAADATSWLPANTGGGILRLLN